MREREWGMGEGGEGVDREKDRGGEKRERGKRKRGRRESLR